MADVVKNQASVQRPRRAKGRVAARARSAIFGLFAYAAVVLWCATQLPTSLLFVGPGAVAGVWLHVVKGRRVLGVLAFLVIVGLAPLLFWPSMLTGLFSNLTTD
jgi:hypothetical protein